MAIGDSYQQSYKSAFGLAEESAWGTFKTATAFLEFDSESLMKTQDEVIIESLNTNRNPHKRFLGNEDVSGSVEAPLNPAADAVVYLIKQAMGGTVTSVAAVTTTTLSYKHTIQVGDMESNKATTTVNDLRGLSFQVRKGGTHVWNYHGMRVNNLTIQGEVGQYLKLTAECVGKTATLTSALSTTITFADQIPLLWTGVSIRNNNGTGTITTPGSGTAETYQRFEVSINNNLQTDMYDLGSRQRGAAPANNQEVTLKLTQRFDTTTAYTRFRDETALQFGITLGGTQTITASSGDTMYSMFVLLPNAYLKSPGIPEVGGRGEILSLEQEFTCLRQNTSTSSGAVQIDVYNATSSYQGPA